MTRAILSNAFFLIIVLGLGDPSLALGKNVDGKKAEQVVFEKKKIQLAGKTLTVEIADNDEKRAQGLMFRKSLPENQGMLFIFDEERSLAFWMKNTLIPLSIGYFDSNRVLIEVLEMVPAVMGVEHPPSYPSSKPARYALEMPKGWFEKNKIRPGATFKFTDK